MVNADFIRKLLRKEPFEPFRLIAKDGRVFDIMRPQLHLVSGYRWVIGIQDPLSTEPVAARQDHVYWDEIDRLEADGHVCGLEDGKPCESTT